MSQFVLNCNGVCLNNWQTFVRRVYEVIISQFLIRGTPASAMFTPLDIMDLTRIELVSPQCECGVLPLDHRPLPMSNGVKMRCIVTILQALVKILAGERMPRNTVLLWAPEKYLMPYRKKSGISFEARGNRGYQR